jgi:hypothetical protein
MANDDPFKEKGTITLAGTMPTGEFSGMGFIRNDLLAEPRTRRFVVCEMINMRTVADHPEDDDDAFKIVLRVVDMEPILIPDDVNTVRSLRDRAKLNRPGQGSFDEAKQQEQTDDELAAARQNRGQQQ